MAQSEAGLDSHASYAMADPPPINGADVDPLERAHAVMDAALAAEGADRHTLTDQALRLWRLARYARGEVGAPETPADGEEG